MMQELDLSEGDIFEKLIMNMPFCVACFISGLAADTFGRRPTLIASAILSFTGFIVMTHSFSYTTFLVGRYVSLFGIGVGATVAPLYIGEVAYPSQRGFLNTIPEIFRIMGVWMAVVARAAVGPSSRWRIIFGVGSVPPFVMGLGMLLLPDSPSWLIVNGWVADTAYVLRKTSSPLEVKKRMKFLAKAAKIPGRAIRRNVVYSPIPDDTDTCGKTLRNPNNLKLLKPIFASILALHFFQQASGVDVITYDTILTFGISDPFGPRAYLLGRIPFICGSLLPLFVPLVVSDVVGRKTLILCSMAAVGVSLLAINLLWWAGNSKILISGTPATTLYKWSSVLFLASFSMGLGPMTWVHTSEGFPFKIRAQLFGVMMTFDQMVSLGLSKTRVVLDTKVKGVPNLFFVIIFGISTIGILVCWKCIKETNNQCLEEIDLLLMGKKVEVEEVEARDQEQVVGAGTINVELVPLAELTV